MKTTIYAFCGLIAAAATGPVHAQAGSPPLPPQTTDGATTHILTQRRHDLKLSGDISSQINSLGQGNVSLSAGIDVGRWTFDSQVYVDHFIDRSALYLYQAALNADGNAYDLTDRRDVVRSRADTSNTRLTAAYKLSTRGTLTFKGEYGRYDSLSRGTTYYRGLDDFDEGSMVWGGNHHSDVQALYDYVGDRNGEYLSLIAEHSAFSRTTISTYQQSSGNQGSNDTYGSQFGTTGTTDRVQADRVQADYERRFGPNRLTVGASLERTANHLQSGLESAESFIGLADYSDGFAATRTVTAGYATWQMPVGRWAVLPGLRAETERLRLGDTETSEALIWYPTLHASRDLTDKVRVKVDYSRHVLRPDLGEYDPAVRYYGALKAMVGNPDIMPQITDAYELGYTYDDKDFGADITLYYRDTHGSFTAYAQLTDSGLLLTSRINSGRSQSGGMELNWHGPVSQRLSYSVSADLFHSVFPFADGGTRNLFSWSGNAVLAYDADNGDQYQLNATGYGKALTLQGYTRGFSRLDASWQHPLNDRLSLVVTVADIFNTARFSTVVDTQALKTVSSGRPNLRAVKLALTYSF